MTKRVIGVHCNPLFKIFFLFDVFYWALRVSIFFQNGGIEVFLFVLL